MDRRALVLGGLAVGAAGCAAAVRALQTDAAAGCPPVGSWVGPSGARMTKAAAISQAAAADIVLLGETHAAAAEHQWQADMLAALAQTGRAVAVGIEYLPRAMQPALQSFARGEIGEADFLLLTDWDKTWGSPFALYRPIFDWARARGAPMVALNVDRGFVRAVARQGFDAVAADSPVGRPAPASARYRAMLEDSFSSHHGKAPDAAMIARFVEAQTVWDRAMAEGLLAMRALRPDAVSVGLMGRGHVAYGDGVAYQIRAINPAAKVIGALPIPAATCALPVGEAELRAIV